MGKYKHNVIALVYDFDGTLTPQPMQEYTIFPDLGIKDGKRFWQEVSVEAKVTQGEGIVTYMRLMIEKSKAQKYPVTKAKLKKLATKIEYFSGVERYFSRINKYVKDKFNSDVELRHYIISAGLKEIIEGTKIAKHFHRIFASEYYYDEYGAATFPNVIVNDTLKTQFIFRINKGLEEMHTNINLHMPSALRAIPFQNILYIGDGLTDVPCMTVIRQNGGFAIAVFKKRDKKGKEVCQNLLNAERVDFMASADYSNDSELDKHIKLLLHNIFGGIRYGKASFTQAQKYLKIKKREQK